MDNLIVKNVNGFSVISMSIKTDITIQSSLMLKKKLIEVVEKNERVLLDLSALRFQDTSGICALVSTLRYAMYLNHSFVLFNLNKQAQELFELTDVYNIFTVYKTEEEALDDCTV